MSGQFVIYQFSRSKVERGDFGHFLGIYGLDRLPQGRRLRDMQGSMAFVIEGYDQDEREIHSIPEVRKFYRAFHQAWPYWLYFCTLEEDAMKMMVLCCLNSFTMVKIDGRSDCQVHYEPTELIDFLKQGFPYMNQICDRAGMFPDRVAARTNAIVTYFGLPARGE